MKLASSNDDNVLQNRQVNQFVDEDLLPIMGDERMIQELPEQFTRRIQ